MQECLQSAPRVMLLLDGAMDDNKKQMVHTETSKQGAILAVERAFRQMIDTLEERKNALISQLETISFSKTTSLNGWKDQLKRVQRSIGHCTGVASHVLKTHSDYEVVAVGDLVHSELKASLNEVESVIPIQIQHGTAFFLFTSRFDYKTSFTSGQHHTCHSST